MGRKNVFGSKRGLSGGTAMYPKQAGAISVITFW